MDGFPKQETRWVCSDKLTFAQHDAAWKHETKLDRAKRANEVLESGGTLGNALRAANYQATIHTVFDSIKAREALPTRSGATITLFRITPDFRLYVIYADDKDCEFSNLHEMTLADLARDLVIESGS